MRLLILLPLKVTLAMPLLLGLPVGCGESEGPSPITRNTEAEATAPVPEGWDGLADWEDSVLDINP